jgi:hypothetical protein
VRSTIKLYVLVYQITSEIHLDVVQSVLLALIVVMIELAKTKNALIHVSENVDKMLDVELTIIVLFVIVMRDILEMLSPDVILSHVRNSCLCFCNR